jgi:hypothetical protein
MFKHNSPHAMGHLKAAAKASQGVKMRNMGLDPGATTTGPTADREMAGMENDAANNGFARGGRINVTHGAAAESELRRMERDSKKG